MIWMPKDFREGRKEKKTDGGIPEEAPFFLIFFSKNN